MTLFCFILKEPPHEMSSRNSLWLGDGYVGYDQLISDLNFGKIYSSFIARIMSSHCPNSSPVRKTKEYFYFEFRMIITATKSVSTYGISVLYTVVASIYKRISSSSKIGISTFLFKYNKTHFFFCCSSHTYISIHLPSYIRSLEFLSLIWQSYRRFLYG